jgi:uncharacterized membrane protein
MYTLSMYKWLIIFLIYAISVVICRLIYKKILKKHHRDMNYTTVGYAIAVFIPILNIVSAIFNYIKLRETSLFEDLADKFFGIGKED